MFLSKDDNNNKYNNTYNKTIICIIFLNVYEIYLIVKKFRHEYHTFYIFLIYCFKHLMKFKRFRKIVVIFDMIFD